MTTMDQIHHIRELFYSQGKNISEIAKETGASTATISRVNRSMIQGNGSYEQIFERLGIGKKK